MYLMSTVKETNFTDINVKELFDFSKKLQEYYYSCILEKQPDTNGIWKCAKFSNLSDAEKYREINLPNAVLTKIVPYQCSNPFEYFENKIVYDKVNFPVEIIKNPWVVEEK